MIIKRKYIFLLFFLNFGFSQINMQINLLNTAQYTLSNFNDPTVEQWTVLVTNSYPFPREINLEIALNYNDIEPAIWGVTKTIELGEAGNNNSIILRNSEFMGTDMRNYIQNNEFVDLIESLGYLPAGDFELIIRAYFVLDNDEIDPTTYSITAPPVAVQQINISNSVSSEISLVEPANNSDVIENYPWFRWDSPGFTNGVDVDYHLKVYQYNPEISSNPEDALSNDNQLFFDSNWGNIVTEIGSPQLISIQYPSNDRELACGYEYVWIVEAREVIESMDNEGIWGWPEPIISPIYTFSFGSRISSDNILSPNIGSEVSSVRPIFSFEGLFCAESYEIWLSNSEDTDIDNPIWKSESIQSTSAQYPSDEIGLVPGETYYWKIRINPDSEPGPWSEIFSFNIPSIKLSEPLSAEYVNTVYPTFNIEAPSGISSFQLRISNSDDPEVVESNIFSNYIMTFPYIFPDDATNSLFPNETYYWSVISYDENGNMVGQIENYGNSSFSINSINLNQPQNGTTDISLTPNFTWESPIGVPNFIFILSDGDDPSLDSPFFSTVISGTYFQYSQFADIVLDNSTTYHWGIIPTDSGENFGIPTSAFSFTTLAAGTEADEFTILQTEFSLSLVTDTDKSIKANIIEGVSGADEYLVSISTNQDMENPISEASLSQYETETIFLGEILEWSTSYYIQIIALSEGEIIGEASNIYVISTPSKPGSDDQVVFTIDNSGNLLLPNFQITNTVMNAIDYLLILSIGTDMSDILYEIPIEEDVILVYSVDDPQLSFGNTYYFQVYAFDDDGIHGIASSIVSLYISNIIPPNLSDILFSWEPSTPQSDKYRIEISLTEDFSNIIFSETIAENSLEFNQNNFLPGTSYYWRIQGMNTNGESFGNASSVGYFLTEGQQEEIISEEEPGDQDIEEETDDESEDTDYEEVDDEDDEIEDEPEEVIIIVDLELPINNALINTQQPTFKWIEVESAEKYEIKVCTDNELTEIVWSSSNVLLNEIKYPSLGSEPLLFNQVYYWTVRALAENVALGDFAIPSSFSITSDFIPVLEGPLNEISTTLHPYFTWGQIQFAEKYELILGTNEDLSHIIYQNNNIVDHLFQFPMEPPLSTNTAYYWKIGSYDGNGEILGDYSSIGSFTTPSGTIEIEFIYEDNP